MISLSILPSMVGWEVCLLFCVFYASGEFVDGTEFDVPSEDNFSYPGEPHDDDAPRLRQLIRKRGLQSIF